MNQSKPPSKKRKVTPEKTMGKRAEFGLKIFGKIFGIFCSGFSFEVHLTHIFDGKVMTADSHASRCGASRPPQFAELSYAYFQQSHVK